MTEAPTISDRDLSRQQMTSFLIWKLPGIVMVGSAILDIGSVGQALIWAPCLGIFAVGCLANAMRCRRVHCYFTGPFFLVMAAASLLHGAGVVSLGEAGWSWIELMTLTGAAVFFYVPELLWGKYFGSGEN